MPTGTPAEQVLSGQAIEIPSLDAWRWRAQRAIRTAGMEESGAGNTYAVNVSYFLNLLGKNKNRGDYSVVLLDEPPYFSEDEKRVDADDSETPHQTLSEYLESYYPEFSEPTHYHRVNAVRINHPDQFEKKLKLVSEIRWKNRYAHSIKISGNLKGYGQNRTILPGLLHALKLTQTGEIYDTDSPRIQIGSTLMPSFNSLLEHFSESSGESERIGKVAGYIEHLRKRPLAEIVDRVELHQQYANVIDAF